VNGGEQPPSEPSRLDSAGGPRDEQDAAAAQAALTLINIAGVRLRPGGRSFVCDAGPLLPKVGARVIVQADRGQELGIVMVAPSLRPGGRRIPRIIRLADERDLSRAAEEDQRVANALDFARQAIRERSLAIKVFHAETQANGKATFYFASDARIDFRDLVRDLSTHLRMRVEMRQVGVRDEAKMVGGIGSCGRELCCSTFLPRFAPISIKAAKNQNIALTPSKVSGQCGRLKCCLVYEEANYVEAAKLLPKMGKRVETPDGVGRVGDLDVLRGKVRVLFPDGPPKVYEGHELRPAAAPGAPGGPAASPRNDDHRPAEPALRPPEDGPAGSDIGDDRGGENNPTRPTGKR